MTYETMYNHICVLLQEYDLHTGSRAADGVISNPEKWVDSEYFLFYASAAALLIETSGYFSLPRTVSTSSGPAPTSTLIFRSRWMTRS